MHGEPGYTRSGWKWLTVPKRLAGMVEYWNSGILGSADRDLFENRILPERRLVSALSLNPPTFHRSSIPAISLISFFQNSIQISIPSFHHSIIPPLHHSIIPSFHHSSIPVFQCSSVPVFQCSSVPVFQCSSTPVFHHSSVPQFHHSSIPPSHSISSTSRSPAHRFSLCADQAVTLPPAAGRCAGP